MSAIKMSLLSSTWSRVRRQVGALVHDCRGIAATEFAMIVPIMLLLFFGTVELSSAIAIKRKLALVTRAASDLTSQSLDSVKTTDMQNVFAASGAILLPYSLTPLTATVSEIFIDKDSIAKIQWSQSATVAMASGSPQATLKASPHKPKDTVSVPQGLLIPNTWLIWSEVNYTYTPTVGYVLKSGVPMDDETYTRPRQSSCVDYPPPTNSINKCAPVS
ncbi:TadE/TadG family type IV pilus assembly protein [Bradyrhizobium cenepequi]|uniref:TadE/TadG family type IV pilus assembly protein n=1 Tax=Bradyrhizobium cenepequi TaxID=2821403 RepID=UPI001CE388F1|nr:TadE/TadG family type IV pilus assembly protein [Bradyrhizobium cenepequi]MCA6105955.1 pilus assembly protein [Bradyrhizobium cenepequi]